LFDISKLPEDVRILNGDISEEVAKSLAKTLVDQLKSQKAHEQYQMIPVDSHRFWCWRRWTFACAGLVCKVWAQRKPDCFGYWCKLRQSNQQCRASNPLFDYFVFRI